MKIINLMAFIGLFGACSTYGQDFKQLIITNRSGGGLKVAVGVDNKAPLEFRLVEYEQEVIPFDNTINSIEIKARDGIRRSLIGADPYNYGTDAQKLFFKDDDNIEVQIKPPTIRFLSAVAPYKVEVTSVKGSITFRMMMPSSGKLLGVFPHVAKSLQDEPEHDTIVVTDVFALSNDSSYPTFLARYNHLKQKWTQVKDAATDQAQQEFAQKVLFVLDEAFQLLQDENPLFTARKERRTMTDKISETIVLKHPITGSVISALGWFSGNPSKEQVTRKKQELKDFILETNNND